MRKKIPVKYGWEMFAIIGLVIFYPMYSAIADKEIFGIYFSIGISIFILAIIFGIRYEMDEEYLYVYNTYFICTKIEIKRIYKIEKTWNIISSPAPSMAGRVEIYWPAYNSIVISPRNFEDFRKELLRVNPTIEVKL
jgi:hypothetical protein